MTITLPQGSSGKYLGQAILAFQIDLSIDCTNISEKSKTILGKIKAGGLYRTQTMKEQVPEDFLHSKQIFCTNISEQFETTFGKYYCNKKQTVFTDDIEK